THLGRHLPRGQRASKYAPPRPASQCSAHIGQGFAVASVQPPNQVAGNLFVLGIGIKDGGDINGCDRPQQEAGVSKVSGSIGGPPRLTGIRHFWPRIVSTQIMIEASLGTSLCHAARETGAVGRRRASMARTNRRWPPAAKSPIARLLNQSGRAAFSSWASRDADRAPCTARASRIE